MNIYFNGGFYADYTGSFRPDIKRLRVAGRFIKRKRLIAAVDQSGRRTGFERRDDASARLWKAFACGQQFGQFPERLDFEPQFVKKNQTRFDGLDEKIISPTPEG